VSHASAVHAATAALVEYAVGSSWSGFPPEVQAAGQAILLDTLGAMVGARSLSLTVAAPLLRYAELEGGAPRASIVGQERMTGPALAALVNGTLAYGLDIESIHGPSITHAAAVVVPAALAVAEATGCSGADLLAAIVVGLDVADRVSRAISPRALYDRGLHPSSVAGTPAAALAAARLLGLDAAAARRALGLAASQASGLMAWESDPTEHARPFNCGIAARNGVTGAMLASAGFGGPEDALEGEHGLLGAFGDERTDGNILAEELGTTFAVLETQIKAYACCAFLQPGVNAVVALREANGVQPDEVESITLHFPKGGASIIDDNPVRSHNTQYVLAVALHDLDVTFDDLAADRRLTEPALAALSHKVQVVHSEPLDPEFPARYTSRVVIGLKDGREVESLVTYPSGHPNNPLTPDQLRAKLERLATPVVGAPTVQALLGEIETIAEAPSVKPLMALLRRGPIQAPASTSGLAGNVNR
jgi:2-methylcitrate dehydratase PrpD